MNLKDNLISKHPMLSHEVGVPECRMTVKQTIGGASSDAAKLSEIRDDQTKKLPRSFHSRSDDVDCLNI